MLRLPFTQKIRWVLVRFQAVDPPMVVGAHEKKVLEGAPLFVGHRSLEPSASRVSAVDVRDVSVDLGPTGVGQLLLASGDRTDVAGQREEGLGGRRSRIRRARHMCAGYGADG